MEEPRRTPRTMVVLTRSFPFRPGEEFAEPEAPHWAVPGWRVVVMPWQVAGDPRPLPEGVEIDRTLSQTRQRWHRLAVLPALVGPEFVPELLRRRRELVSRPAATVREVLRVARGVWVTRRALRQRIAADGPIDLAYSYWFDVWGLGALTLAGRGIGTVASRVHRYDLYETLSPAGFHATKRHLGPRLDWLLPIGRSSAETAMRDFGVRPASVHLAPLGVSLPETTTPGGDGDTVTLVSCSHTVPVKRVDKIIDALAIASRAEPGLRFHWTHLGGGPELDDLRARASSLDPARVTADLVGARSHDEVLDWFAGHPADLFVNVSDSEGLPVTIMEAMAAGIPVLAPAVGDIGDLVPADGPGGWLLPTTPTPQQIADALLAHWREARSPEHRAEARRLVAEGYESDRNAEALMRFLTTEAVAP
ncbi:glycosyltransferase [Aestuariimicrobium soli]|uniref:glycosyltransferase n=1 Tax=Aestuariimicrobium soli TaxID=2035834 RepID=UPI003EBABC8B